MKTFDRVVTWDYGVKTYYCSRCGNHKGEGHSKRCKHWVDKDAIIKELKKQLKIAKGSAKSCPECGVIVK